MIYTINYTKKNSFMNVKGIPDKRRITPEGDIVDEGKYNQAVVPGASRVYRPKFSLRKKRYLVNATQEELNKIVQDMRLYDDRGNQIMEAPLSNENAPFWHHKQCQLHMDNMSATIDDEVARDKFFLRCFEADPSFRVLGDDINPAIAANVKFSIAKAEQNVSRIDHDVDRSMRATELLNTMGYEKQVSILKAMGIDTRNPDPGVVKNVLFKKVTDEKALRTGHSAENNLDLFLRLANSTSEELNLQALIEQARSSKVITKHKDGKYKFGAIILGKTLSEVRDYLKNEDNADVLNEIMEQCQ